MKTKKTSVEHISIPKKRKQYSYSRHTIGALDRRNIYENGGASDILQIDTQLYPFVSSAKAGTVIGPTYDGEVLDLCICDGIIYALIMNCGEVSLSEFDPQSGNSSLSFICESDDNDPEHYCIVRYNEFSSETDAINGEYTKKVLVLPHYYAGEINREGEAVFETGDAIPHSTVATVFMSRIFSASKGKLFASEFNNAMGYNFDTADESLSSNAWMSNTQSNTKADGDITALIPYDGHVVVFKRDYMMQLYNNTNPFRLVDIGSYGCISKRAVCEFDGKLAFISPRGVMLYSGGYPYFIGEELNISDWEGAQLCSFGKLLYVYVPSEIGVYVYDAEHELWGHRNVKSLSYMCADHTGAYYLYNNQIYRFDQADANFYSIVTDRSTLGHEGKKRLCSLSFTAIIEDGASLIVDLVDESFNNLLRITIREAGEHVITQKINGISLNFAQLMFMGQGNVRIGEYTIKYRKEED